MTKTAKSSVRRRLDFQNGYSWNNVNNNNNNGGNNNNNNNVVENNGPARISSDSEPKGLVGLNGKHSTKARDKCTATSIVTSSTLKVYVIPILVCLFSYSNSLNGDLVHDDVFAIRENRDVVGSDWSWRRLLTDDFWGAPLRNNNSHKSYRPLTTLTYRLNFLISGHNTFPYHVINLVLHTVCTILVTYISSTIFQHPTNCRNSQHHQNCRNVNSQPQSPNCRLRENGVSPFADSSDTSSPHSKSLNENKLNCRKRDDSKGNSRWLLSGSGSAAMLTGLVFAVHPIHTEAVSGLVGRADVLACMFFLLSFISYHSAISSASFHGRKFLQYILSITMATAAMLSKEHGVMALVVNSADDVITAYQDGGSEKTHRKSRHRWWKCKYRVLANAFTFLLLFYCRWLVMGGELPHFNETDNPAAFSSSLLTRLLTFLYLPVFNMFLLMYPATLSYDWQYGSIPLLESIRDPRTASIPVFYTVLAVLTWKALRSLKDRSARPLQYGILLLCIPFIPATNLFFTVGFVVAERVLYIPSIGYCLILIYGLTLVSSTATRRRLSSLLLVMVVLGMTVKTLNRNAVWRTRRSLFRSGVETLPNNAKMHYNYANYLRDANETQSAIQHFRTAISLYPKFASAHNNLGLLLTDHTEAEKCYKTTIQYNPKHANAHLNLGVMYMNSGHREAGLPFLERAAELNPRYALHLANAYISTGKDTRAIEVLRRAVTVDRLRDQDTMRLYTQQLVRAGLFEEAEPLVGDLTSLTSSEQQVDILVDKALILHASGRQDQAIDIIRSAVKAAQEADALKELARFYQKINQHHESLILLNKARQIDPDNLQVLLSMAISLSGQEKYNEAEKLFLKVLDMDRDDLDVIRGLSSMYGAQGRHQEGLEVIKRSVDLLEARGPGLEVELVKALNMKASHERDLHLYTEAARSYQRLLELDGENVHARINLGAIFHLQSKLAEAREHYVVAQRLSPNNKLVQENLQKVDRLLNRQRT